MMECLTSLKDAIEEVKEIGYPVRVIPAFSSSDRGTTTVKNKKELEAAVKKAKRASGVNMFSIVK